VSEGNNIPKHWQAVKVSDVGDLIRGVNYKKKDSATSQTENYLPIFRSNNIHGDLNYEDLVYVKRKNISDIQLIQKGDIVFAMSSGSKHLVGKSAKAKKDFNGGFGAFCAVFRANEHFNKDFVAYFFQSPYYKKTISEISKGTNINNLKREHILDLDFPSPPLPEQQSIVSKIEELLSDLENGKQQLQIAQQQLIIYRQSLLKWAFEGRFGYAQRPSNAVKDGELPTGWKWVNLKDVASDISDGDHQAPPKSSNGIPFITISNLNKVTRKIDFTDTFKVKINYYSGLKPNRKPQQGDVLYTVTGSFGIPILIDFEKEFCFQRHIGLIRPLRTINQKWVYYLLQSPFVFSQARDTATGTAQKTVALSSLRNFRIPFCPLSEQQLIVNELDSKLTVCDKIEETISKSLQKVETLRQSILKKAFEGKLVKMLNTDNC
jgi:type I restriction enzyme S subunit